MNTKLIKAECDNLINDFAKSLNALDVTKDESKAASIWDISLKTIKIEFLYTTKDDILIPNSSLVCSFYLEKNSDYPYTIQQVINFLGINDFHCYDFSFIENEKRMRACFNEIAEFINRNLNAINELVVGDYDFINARQNEYKRCFKTDKIEDFVYDIAFENQIARYTNFPAYKLFLKGKYKNSLKKYYKIKNKDGLYDYEEKLVAFMDKLLSSGESFEAIKPECASIIEVSNYDGTSNAKVFLLSFLIAFVCLVIPITIIVQILYHYYTAGTIFSNPVEQLIWSAIIALEPAIFVGISFVDKAVVFISKNKEMARDFSSVLLPPKTKKFSQFVSGIMIVIALVFCVLLSKPECKFYSEYMLYDVGTGIFSQEFVEYKYDDIKAIYHIDHLYNEETEELIDVDAFILRFENGDVNTYYCDISNPEETIVPLLKERLNDEIKYVNSDLDI